MQIALAQTTTIRDLDFNLNTAERLCKEAEKHGADWILFPENAPFMGHDLEKLRIAEPLDGPIIRAYGDFAKENSMWVTVGSFAEKTDLPDQTYNTLVMINPDGEITEFYRKIHRFDAKTSRATYRESKHVMAGNDVKVCTVTVGSESVIVGLSICYDLRFPEMYRMLREKGAQVLLVPAAFAMETGRDHWNPLLKARAIENQCYVLAPNQVGNHYDDRWTYGHTSAYDPWGTLVASASDVVGLIYCDLDLEFLRHLRKNYPSFKHRVLG